MLRIELSIPYWDFLILNLWRCGCAKTAGKSSFNSLLGFSNFESLFLPLALPALGFVLSIPYWDFLILNPRCYEFWPAKTVSLSIPYWDFLILNRIRFHLSRGSLFSLSIPYWDFLILNQSLIGLNLCLLVVTFNSLLGFSNFESASSRKQSLRAQWLSIPYWDFLILNPTSVAIKYSFANVSFQFPIGIF